MKSLALILARVALFAAIPVFGAGAASPGYHLLKEIPVPTDGSWDYLSVDSANHRLYVSHATRVVVIDTDKDAVVGEIADTPGVHGVAVVPKLGRGFVSNGKGNNVSMVDLKTLQTLSKVETGQNPDWIMYEPGQDEIYAFNGGSQSSTVIAAATGKVVATIPLGGKPETAQADPSLGRIFDNLEDKDEVAVIDTKTHAVVDRWPIAPGKAASGMAIDLAHKRLFLGAADANLMVMLDYTSGKVAGSVPIGAGVDACSFDPGTQLAFSSCGGPGTVTIAHEDGPDKLTVVQTLTTERGAKTMTLDPVTHKIYLGAVKYLAPAAGAAPSRGRPQAVPGTFRVLVYGPGQ
jgi:YVTN family beta-propeller protein